MLALTYYYGYSIGEISCPTKYFPDASSINLKRSIKYGFGVLGVSISYFLARLSIFKTKIFQKNAEKLDLEDDIEYYHKSNN